jgi:hypothetical protein
MASSQPPSHDAVPLMRCLWKNRSKRKSDLIYINVKEALFQYIFLYKSNIVPPTSDTYNGLASYYSHISRQFEQHKQKKNNKRAKHKKVNYVAHKKTGICVRLYFLFAHNKKSK